MPPKIKKQPLRERLLADGLALTADEAEKIIRAGLVRVGDQRIDKPGTPVAADALISVVGRKAYVGRGALKLEEAFETFRLSADGLICADVGVCTGGFTEVLLRRGASKVYAIDVGYGDLDWKIRSDSRVVVMERTNARYVERLPDPVSLVSIDVSFISLTLILPAVCKWLAPGGQVVALVKPQFEASREEIGEGGIVRDSATHDRVIQRIKDFLPTIGLVFCDLCPSPILGTEGNKEFLLWARHNPA
jgi:23S rRNA (cytidine1920-2'-O)/16S rRNA (cytidine1409-2'-O)-methyltransferase